MRSRSSRLCSGSQWFQVNRKSSRPIPLNGAAAAAARYDLGLAYRAAGQTDRADAMLASLAGSSTDPRRAEAQFMVGQRHVEQGKFAEATGPLQRYLEAQPDGDVADYALAHLTTAQIGLGQIDEAAKSQTQLSNRFPASKALASTRLRLGEAALEAARYSLAVDQFQGVLGTEPTLVQPVEKTADPTSKDPVIRARAQAGLGRALWRLGKPAEAAKVFTSIPQGIRIRSFGSWRRTRTRRSTGGRRAD